MAHQGPIRIGTSGWVYRDWRGVFYPEGLPARRWFAFYSASFDTVEVNSSFYHVPTEKTFAAWHRQAPAGFLYALKANRELTHRKRLKEVEEPLATFLERVRLLGPHLGPILYQLPPHWHANPQRLRSFVALLPRDLDHVFEFRDASWYNDEVRALLTEAGVNFCIHDLRGEPCPDWVTGPLVYVRFHGPTRKAYVGRYDRAHLRQWARRLEEFQRQGRGVYAYFNNDFDGNGVFNARELQELLGVALAHAPGTRQ